MKRLIQFFFIFFTFSQVFSQEKDSITALQSFPGRLAGLINIQDLGAEGSSFEKDDFEGHWAGIELGINGFAHADYTMYPPASGHFLKNNMLRSNTLNLNLLQYSHGLQQVRNNFGLITGLGLSFQSYHLGDHTTISLDENNKVQPRNLYYDSNQKSKFSMLYIDIPILLEIQIPVNHIYNRIYFSAGLTGSKRLESHTKIKYRENGKKEKLKSPDDYSTNNYKVAATFRMGYRSVNMYFTYDLVPLFETGNGPVLYPISAGIRLISF